MRTTIIFDPLNKTPETVGPEEISDACGLPPQWVLNSEHAALPLREALELQYGFGPLPTIEDASLTEDLQLQYPGDPLLSPLLIIERRPSETFIQYPHSLVCLRTTEGDFFTRMD